MMAKILERSAGGLLLFIAAGMAIHAPLTLWLGLQFPQYELFIKSWKELLMGLALVLVITIAARRKIIDGLMNDRLIQLSLVYAGIHFALVGVFQNGLDVAGAGLLIDLRYVLYFVVVYIYIVLFPARRQVFIAVITAGAAAIVGFGLLQLTVLPKDILAHIGYGKATISPYLTVDENPAYVRINSLLRGPNPLGAYVTIVIGIITAVMLRWRLTSRGFVLAGSCLAAAFLVLNATYSRSSLIGAAIAITVIVIVCATPRVRRYLVAAGAVVFVTSAILVGVFRHTPFVANVIFHDNPTTGATVDSNAGHAESLQDGFERMVRQPLGAGVGSTGSASLMGDDPVIIENQYLFVAHEAGWVGLGLFLWLFVEVMRRLWLRRASALALGVFGSGLGLAAIGILLPVWVDDTVSIIWWGLAAVAVAAPVVTLKSRKRKAVL